MIEMCVSYLDFTKAFNSVFHTKLLHVLKLKGLEGRLPNWVANSKNCWMQSVSVNGCKSTGRQVAFSIPPDIVRGPLLLITFIANLVPIVSHSELFFYAEDCKASFAVRFIL